MKLSLIVRTTQMIYTISWSVYKKKKVPGGSAKVMLARKKMSQKQSNSVGDAESRIRSDVTDGYEIINKIDEKAENLLSDMDNSPPTLFFSNYSFQARCRCEERESKEIT